MTNILTKEEAVEFLRLLKASPVLTNLERQILDQDIAEIPVEHLFEQMQKSVAAQAKEIAAKRQTPAAIELFNNLARHLSPQTEFIAADCHASQGDGYITTQFPEKEI